MLEFFSKLLDTSDFPARWHCGDWSAGHGWLHIVSDLGVWSAYVAIPCVLGYFLLRRKDLPFRLIFLLFGAFILACGTTHLMEALLFWWPAYRLAGVIKLFTALVSWGTVVALIPIVPQVLAMRSPEAVEREIAARRRAEGDLRAANAELERRLAALRTSEERFRLLVEGTTDYALYLLDAAGHVISWNPGAERIKQYRAEEIVGQHFSRFFPAEAVAVDKPARALRVAAAEGRFEEEGWRVRKDGSRFWANVVVTALRDEAGQLRGFSKITRDVTERKQAEENARLLLREEAARREAEKSAEEIREQRERLRVTLHSIGDGVIVTDGAGRVSLLNPVAEALTGWTSAEAAGQPFQTVFPIVNETTRQGAVDPVARVLREGVIVGLANHTLLLARDGSERPIDDSAAPIKDARDHILGVVLIFRDCSEQRGRERRRAARLAVAHTLAEAHTLGEAAPRILRALGEYLGWNLGGYWVVAPDGDALHCLELWHTPSVRGEGFLAACRQATFRRGVGLPGRVWASGQPAWVADLGADENFPRAEIAAREGLRAAFGFPLLAGGEVLGVVEFFSDQAREPDDDLLELATTVGALIGQFMERHGKVEELKRAEQTFRFLAEASAELARLVDFESTLQKVAGLAVPHFADWCTIDVLDADGALRRLAVAHVDPAKVSLAHDLHRRLPPDPDAPQGVWNVLRTGRSELIGEIPDALLAERVADAELLQLLRALGLKSYIGVPLVVRGQTLGVISFIAAESNHRYDAHDLAVAEDLARRAAVAIDNARLYAEARADDRRKDEFLATLAHELRNPLAPLRNALQIMALAGEDRATVEQSRKLMERQLQQMVRLVDDLLDVSRISRGKFDLRTERVELAAVLRTAVETSQPLVESLGHELTVTLPPESVPVDADPTRLAQVFANLINNAAKYTERGGHLWLNATRTGNAVLVSVRDNGVGIPRDMLTKVFDMFTQVERSLERSQGGLGIGLTLVKRLVEMHGGSVEARSEGPGRGSTFLVRLPVAAAPAPVREAAQVEEKASPRRRVLVVDDNKDAADSLALMLRLLGNEVHTAYDGLAGVEAAAAVRPDLVLLDIGMPKLNGYEAARRIRAQPGGQDAVLVALTGWGQEEDVRRSREAGFDQHYVKPILPGILEGLLANLRGAKR